MRGVRNLQSDVLVSSFYKGCHSAPQIPSESEILKGIRLKQTKFRTKIKEWNDALLQGTHNHYSCHLPKDIGFASSLMFKLFFSGIDIKKDQTDPLKNIPEDAIIVYATKYRSYFEYLFYHTRYKQNGVPPPQIGF